MVWLSYVPPPSKSNGCPASLVKTKVSAWNGASVATQMKVDEDCAPSGYEELVRGHDFVLDLARVEPPPPDASWLFQHFGNSGNAGVSGQR